MTLTKEMALLWGPLIGMWIMHLGLWPLYRTNLGAVKLAWLAFAIVVLIADPVYWLYG